MISRQEERLQPDRSRRRGSKHAHWTWLLAALAMIGTQLPAQLALDEDPAALPLLQLASTGSHTQRNSKVVRTAHVVRDRRVIRQKQVLVENRGGRCDLVVDRSGYLRLENCFLRLRGDLFLKDHGVLELVDCRVQVENTRPREFGYWWEGGELRTRRCLIGGMRGASGLGQIAVFQLNRGRWLLHDTTVQYSGGILLGEGREGHSKDPFLRGGSLIADGLYQGLGPDAVVVSGHGDVTIRNSSFNVHLFVYADSGRASNSKLDFTTDRVITSAVYGDRAVQDTMPLTRTPITRDLPGAPYRLEITNSRVPFWFLSVVEIANSGPVARFEIENTTGLLIGLHGENLRGRPVRTGRWSTDPNAPELPVMELAGSHEIPPASGVRIGNAEIAAPPNAAARVANWSFYLRGLQTDFAIRGPTKIAELALLEGKLTIEGREAYDARVAANTINMHRDSELVMRNVSLGEFSHAAGIQGSVLLHGKSRCTIDGALIQGMRFESQPEPFCCRYEGVNASTLTIRNFITRGAMIERRTGASRFDVARSTAQQDFDLANLDFDLGVVSAQPSHWSSVGITASTSTDRRPWTSSQRSLHIKTATSPAWMSKRVRLVEGTDVEITAWVKPIRVDASSRVALRARGVGSGTASVLVDLGGSGWREVRLRALRIATDEIVDLGFDFAGNCEVLVDDVEVHVTSWWEDDNFVNLDFDAGIVRGFRDAPLFHRFPDYWQVWDCDAEVESVDLRPGARSGSKAIRLRVRTQGGQLYKVWRRLAPGTRMRIRGYVKIKPKILGRASLNMHVGDNADWWNDKIGNNKSYYIHDARAWTQFQFDYSVPANRPVTRLAITGGSPGDEILVDDVDVEFLR